MANTAREAESRAGYTRVCTPILQEERDERRTWTRTKTKKIPAGWSFSFTSRPQQLLKNTHVPAANERDDGFLNNSAISPSESQQTEVELDERCWWRMWLWSVKWRDTSSSSRYLSLLIKSQLRLCRMKSHQKMLESTSSCLSTLHLHWQAAEYNIDATSV